MPSCVKIWAGAIAGDEARSLYSGPSSKEDLENEDLAFSAREKGVPHPGRGSDVGPLGLWLLMITGAKAITICSFKKNFI